MKLSGCGISANIPEVKKEQYKRHHLHTLIPHTQNVKRVFRFPL